MKIKIINPNTTQSMTDSIYDAALRSADPETESLAVSPKTGPDSIECYVEMCIRDRSTLYAFRFSSIGSSMYSGLVERCIFCMMPRSL